MASARQDLERAGDALKQMRWRHRAEADELTLAVFGQRDAASFDVVVGTHGAQTRAQRAHQVADRARAALERIESLPIGRAARFIETHQDQAQQTKAMRAAAARHARLGLSTEDRRERPGPEFGLGM